jgi:hypothetical protein
MKLPLAALFAFSALAAPALALAAPAGASVLALAAPAGAAAAETRRIAVVVGARAAPPGRAPLRYAHEDARRVSEVLVAFGGFAAADVKTLLDPRPEQLLAVLDSELAQAGQRSTETFLFFYYSGHADDRAIFPAGLPLPLTALKDRLDDRRAALRVGLLDSCRGGGWTGSKGLSKVEPFDIDAAPLLAEEGSVLIASSSGQESAHEAEALEGSFFTHHWNAGLRGAADRGGDGVVTLGEAFEYARALTIRDTALVAPTPQHPSFQMKLSGRQDLPLTTVSRQRTTLVFDQQTGPVELVRLDDGLLVLETPPGARKLRLGLPAGRYLVRRRDGDGVWARVVALRAAGVTALAEADLARSPFNPSYRPKDGGGEPAAGEPSPSWAGERAFASVAAGVRHAPVIDPGLRLASADGDAAFLLRGGVRVGARLWLAAPAALVFDAERPGAADWFAWAGVPVLGATDDSLSGWVVRGSAGAGADVRGRRGRRTINASLSELGAFAWAAHGVSCGDGAVAPDPACAAARDDRHGPTTWTTQLTLGISQALPPSVTLNIGVGVGTDLVVDGRLAGGGLASGERSTVVALGSVQRAGLRPLPLIHIALGNGWGLDAHAVAAYLPSAKGWVETYMAGVSYLR